MLQEGGRKGIDFEAIESEMKNMELKIAVCDDEEVFIEQISRYIVDAAEKYEEECRLISCHSGGELLELCREQWIDAVFLDIAMPGLDGFETAEKLLEIRSNMILIFVSSKEAMVFSSYEYKPFWFVPKSKMEILAKVAQRVIKKIQADRSLSGIIPVAIESHIMEIDLGNVQYFKTDDHYIKLKFRDGSNSESSRDKIDNIETQLCKYYFVRCHNRYLVNCRQISYIEGSECVMHSGEHIPISRSRLEYTKDVFQAYLRSLRC